MSDAQGYAIWTALRRAEERCIAKASAAERELEHALYGYESRLIRLRYAFNASGPLACRTLEATLEGIKLDAVWKILYGIVHDIALYYGGSVVAGTAMGAAPAVGSSMAGICSINRCRGTTVVSSSGEAFQIPTRRACLGIFLSSKRPSVP